MNSKHDNLCNKIKTYLDSRLYITLSNIEYETFDAAGELDNVGFTDDNKYAILIEVKYNNSDKQRKKAYQQLDRAVKYCPFLKDKRVFKFYAYHIDDDFKMEWYK